MDYSSGLDGAIEGALMNKTYEDAYELIENMTMNSYPWPNVRFIHGQRPSTVKAVREDDRYQ
ncbi:casein kinase II subunit alpha, chloroplastic-like [Gossypium australe]|uniref:Casein kinase II subunit alpha, chloroplastic-like n=1 Tax=Gossypium australe TaxID=47621 RepID=A0A5B6UFL1_9ROSI|nr:casein kinase II subunit alpha, chloroplastic-like [Gossypium australe]